MAQKFRLITGDLEIEAERTFGYGYIDEEGVYNEPIVYIFITKNGTKEELDAYEFEQLFKPVPAHEPSDGQFLINVETY